MNWVTIEEILYFLNSNDYDIRKSRNGRWIDQKCTPDVVCIIADCIIEYCKSNDNKNFTSMDIWHNKYTKDNVESIFKKPNPDVEKARNEYDKFFQQPMEMLAYSGVLLKTKIGTRNYYRIQNYNLLEYISFREMNALKFISLYCEKVLRDSDIFYVFENFFNNPNKTTFYEMKQKYINFIINNTKINGKTEASRIFTKILNPMAFERNSYGTIHGALSSGRITKDVLMYNRMNFRDIYSEKPKEMTRKEYLVKIKYKPNENLILYQSNKAKKLLRMFNERFNNGESEVKDKFAIGKATHMHHIFPVNEFSELSSYVENIIALTPGQHFSEAHPNGNTQIINKDFQQVCLIAKTNDIMDSLLNNEEDTIYSFDDLKYVLSVGLDDENFNQIEYLCFSEIIKQINIDYIK